MDLLVLLQCTGGLLEITGVFLMANLYLNLPFLDTIPLLISALGRGKLSKDVADGFDLVEETKNRALKATQGLAFIATGFLIQTSANVLSLFLGKELIAPKIIKFIANHLG